MTWGKSILKNGDISFEMNKRKNNNLIGEIMKITTIIIAQLISRGGNFFLINH